jgi:carboxymethylenebutenolidase
MKHRAIIMTAMLLLMGAGCASGPIKPYSPTPIAPSSATNADMLRQDTGLPVTTADVDYHQGRIGYYAHPEAAGNYPGVVMIHEWWGLNDQIKDMARQLAGEGYSVLAVDLYGKVATTPADAQAAATALDQVEATKNMRDAAAFLRAHGATKLASLGWCFGGGQSLQLALSGEKLDATVIYYGQPVTDQPKLKTITWPVLAIYGMADQAIKIDASRAFQTALDQAGVDNEFHFYPGVGHAFANPSAATYAPAETKDAWANTLAFLKKSLFIKTATFTIDGKNQPLKKNKLVLFDDPVYADLNGDGVEDAAVILDYAPGGTGDFYYVAAAFNVNGDYQGSEGILLGDRIAPQSLDLRDGVIIANYAERKPGEPFTTEPSVGVSKYFRVVNGKLTEVPKP